MKELLKRLHEMRGRKAQRIGRHDISTAVAKLKRLGSGFKIIAVGDEEFVVSVPVELNTEHSKLIDLGQRKGFVTKAMIKSDLQWTKEFTENAVNVLLREGMVWVDDQGHDAERLFWFPSHFSSQTE